MRKKTVSSKMKDLNEKYLMKRETNQTRNANNNFIIYTFTNWHQNEPKLFTNGLLHYCFMSET